MMVTLYMVLPMANMIPLYTLHMCINGTVTEVPDVVAMVMGIQLLYIIPQAHNKHFASVSTFCGTSNYNDTIITTYIL